MSRIRTTLDSVTKAVGSTDLISKFSRLKQGSAAVDGTHAEKALVKAEILTSNNTAATPAPETNMKEEEDEAGERNPAEEEKVKETPFVSTKKSSPSLASAVSTSSTVGKQTMQLFHPAALSTNMDETYRTLAQHINNYFGTSSSVEGGTNKPQEPHNESHTSVSEPILSSIPQKPEDHIPVLTAVVVAKSTQTPATSPLSSENLPSPVVETPSPDTPAPEKAPQSIPAPTTSPKKGFTHYLSYPRPSVQAFVGSYIAPLVPKFRGDPKSIAAEKEKVSAVVVEESAVDKEKEKTESEEEEMKKAKEQLLSQREKIIARVSVDNRTRALVKGMQRVTEVKLLTSRVEELSYHLLEFPETRGVAIKESVLPTLLRLRQARDLPLQAAVREALSLVGYTDPVKGRGIRVLAIDGGGTR